MDIGCGIQKVTVIDMHQLIDTLCWFQCSILGFPVAEELE